MSTALVHDIDCMRSRVKNISGVTKTYTFLPNGGKTLANGATFTYPGDIRMEISKKDAPASTRNIDAFMRAIDRGDIAVVFTPAQFFVDEVTNLTRQLRLRSGVLGEEPPCYVSQNAIDVI